MKVALIHDWLITYRGGEKVLEAIAELFPAAEIFTLIHQPGVSATLEKHRIHTSPLQRLPGIEARYRHFLPLFPSAIQSFDLSGFDLVLSSSHCVAKGARKAGGAKHLSYVHAPMRYMWDLYDEYFGPGRAGLITRAGARTMRPFLRAWDRRSARGVDSFVANSRNIANKISRFYGRQAQVIHPPVELERFTHGSLEGTGRGGYFLWLGAFAPYKRLDLAIEAFSQLGLPLHIAGSGQDEARLKGRKLPPNIQLLGQVNDAEVVDLYRNARALVFTGSEDFGLTPLESQATGRPVIAFGQGGVLETVTAKTGVFFGEQTVEALVEAVRGFDAFEARFQPADARAQAAQFNRASFQRKLLEAVDAVMGSDTGVSQRHNSDARPVGVAAGPAGRVA